MMIRYFIFGTLLITAFVVAFVILLVMQKQRQIKGRLARQREAFDYQQALLHTRVEVQEQTLDTLARELHDNITQSLTGVYFRINALARQDATLRAEAGTAAAELNEVIRQVRLLSHGLASVMVENQDLEEAIRAELSRIRSFAGIACTFSSASLYEPPPEQRLMLFRIVQEALQNILKHAHANRIDLRSLDTEAGYLLEIRDDGIGFDLSGGAAPAGYGIRNMRERVGMLNGSWAVRSAPGEGTVIEVTIPVIN